MRFCVPDNIDDIRCYMDRLRRFVEANEAGNQLFEQLDPLCLCFAGKGAQPREIAARMRKTRGKARANRITSREADRWNCCSRFLRRQRRWSSSRHN